MSWISQHPEKQDDDQESASDPLISPQDQEIGPSSRKERSAGRPWSLRTFIILQVSLVLLYSIVSALVVRYYARSFSERGRSLTYSENLNPDVDANQSDCQKAPAGHLVKPETRPVDGLVEDSIFGQEPSPEVDHAWHNLLDNINLRVTPDEMEKLGYDSLAFQDGSGYLGTMAVYHELHCLKRIRWWLYRDYYWPNMTKEQEEDHFTHAGHCLELARQASICRADTTMIPFKWLHSGVGPHGVEPTTQDGMHHQCAEWAPIEQWASERRVDLFDPHLLVWPE